MKLIIEVAGGCVSGVYYERERNDLPTQSVPDAYVVDLDGAEVGEETKVEVVAVESLKNADEITRKLISVPEARADTEICDTHGVPFSQCQCSPWCQPCGSYHAAIKSAAHWKKLKCFARLPVFEKGIT